MKRLTLHLKNVPRVTVGNKTKLYNTVTHIVSSKKEADRIISGSTNVTKSYLSNF